MTHRSIMPNRPWLTGSTYDKYDTNGSIHYDLFAYDSIDGCMYFEIQATERGKRPVARSVFMYAPEFDVLAARDELPFGLIPLYWRSTTHDRFKRIHARLLAMCAIPEGYSVRSVLCHYVKPYDADPWPRNTLNTYMPYVYKGGKHPGNRKRQMGDVL